jgi:hypothetical protein
MSRASCVFQCLLCCNRNIKTHTSHWTQYPIALSYFCVQKINNAYISISPHRTGIHLHSTLLHSFSFQFQVPVLKHFKRILTEVLCLDRKCFKLPNSGLIAYQSQLRERRTSQGFRLCGYRIHRGVVREFEKIRRGWLHFMYSRGRLV